MLRRATLTTILTIALLAGVVQPAAAWTNGGNGGQGFGTHDWVLAQALRMAGEDGAWVNRAIAYGATDDPDTYNYNSFYHVFKENGGRGAPHAVSELYYKAVVAYRAGNYRAASKYLGVLSHYYADVCQPFHTTNKASKYRHSYHFKYEKAVGRYHYKSYNKKKWITPRSRRPVTDVRAKTIYAAKYARGQYPSLIKSYRKTKSVRKGTPNKVTRRVLSRAANDLADIIVAIPKGEGIAPMPQKPQVSVTYQYPRQHQKIGAHVIVRNSAGRPMEGVAVNFVWKLASGTKTVQRYTDRYGKIHWYENIGGVPLMKTRSVTAQLPSSGESTSNAAWYMPTRVLASGGAGFKAWVPSWYIKPNSNVTVSAQTRDTSGNPVVGIPVTFSWTIDGYAAKYTATTDSNGVARQTRNIGSLSNGTRVQVRADTQSGGYNRNTGTTFEVKR